MSRDIPIASFSCSAPEEPLREMLDDTVGGLMALHRQCGDLSVFWKGTQPLLFAFGPDYNRTLLNDKETFYMRAGHPGSKGTAQRDFRKGLFGINGEEHQRSRRMYLPSFRKTSIESYAPSMASWTDSVISSWKDGQVRDLVRDMKTLAMNVTGRILFGLDDLESAWRVEATFDHWVELNHQTLFTSFLPLDDMPNVYPELLDAAEETRARIRDMLQHKRQAKPAEAEEGDLVSMLLRAQDAGELSEDAVVGQMHSLFNAAHHTTTYAMTWTLFLLRNIRK